MAFDIGLKFSVETAELLNARNALQSLAQAAKDLNNNQDKAAGAADKLAESNDKVAAAADKAEKATGKTSRSAKDMAGETDAAAAKLQKLNDQLGYLRNDLNLSETGFTKSQAGVLAWAKSVGASESIIKDFAGAFDKFNKAMGEQSLDKSVNGLSMLNRQLREFEQLQQLAKDEVTLTSTQVKMLARDMEILKQQNEAFNRESSYGVVELKNNFIEAAKQVNNYTQQAKEAEKAEKERAAVVAATAKANMDVMDQAVAKYWEAEQKKTAILIREENIRQAELEKNRKLVNDSLMQSWAGGVGQKSPELNKMASQYAEEEAASIKRQADAYKIAADAVAYLDREQAKLTMTNDLLSRGFTIASANALFRYKEAMEAAGQSAMQVKQNLYLLEQDLIKRQNTSPFAKMREDMQEMQKQTNHLARAISTQLGDVFISLASGQNPLTVMIQQGDQIRGAVEQAKAAGQDMSKAMQGAFASMANSFKLVGSVLKEFVVDGLNSVSNAMLTMVRQSSEITKIRADLDAGLISPLRASRLEFVASANAMKTLGIAAGALAAGVGVTLLMAFVQLSNEQDKMAQSLAKTGGFFGATTAEAVALSKSLMDVGVKSSTAATVIQEMAKTGNLGKEAFAGIAVAANDAQKWVGIGVDETVKKFSELVKDPIKILNEFTAQTGLLSQNQINAVQSLLDVGDAAGAQKLAIDLLKQGYSDMTSDAKENMSALGVATIELKSSTSELWDEFKNSDGAAAGLTAIAFILKSIVSMASAAVFLAKAMTVSFALGKDISVFDSFDQMEAKRKAALDTIAGYEKDHNDFLKRLWGEQVKGVEQLTAAQKEQNATAGAASQIQSKLNDVLNEGAKANAKEMSKLDFVDAKRLEAISKATKGFSAEAKQAFLNSEEGFKMGIKLSKQYGEEWEKAHKKAENVKKDPKPKETYKVARSNELAETKKFYDEQLKQLKDAESKQEAILKQSYDAKMISFGEYYAKQTELTLTSQREQLAVINESSDKQKAAIQSRMLEHIAAFEKEVRAGGNVVELTNKLDAELANLTRTYGGVTQATDTQTQALQTATDKKFYEFYKELNKNLNESTNAFEKFSETVANNAANRQADLDLQRKLLGTYGAEAEALKASANAMRSYSSEIKKQSDLLKKQDQIIADMRKGRDSLTDDAAKAKVDADIIKRLEERAEIEKNLGDTTALAKKDADQAAIDAVAAYNIKVFQEVRDAISSDLYDAIFEGGSKGADALKNVLKNSFKNFVINVYINPIVGNIVGSVMGAMGMGGGLPGATGGGGFSLGGGSLDIGQSLIDYGYDLAGTSTFMGDAVSSLGTSIKGLETTIKGIPGFESGFGSVLGYGSSLMSLSEGKYGSAIGGAIGTYILPGIGSFIGSSLGGFLDDTLGDLFGGGSPNLGSAYTYNTKTGASKEYGGPEDIGEEADKVTAQLMESTVAGINDLFKKLGSAAKVEDFWGGFAAREDGGDAAWAGGTLSNGVKFGQQWSKDIETELGSVEEAMKQYQVELSKATLDALKQATDIPEYIQNKLKDIDIQNLTSDGVTKLVEEIGNLHAAVSGVNSSFELMGVSLDTASTKSGEYQTSLVESSGGMEDFTNNMTSYYENFYSESERSAKAMESLTETFAEAGIEMPATREEYRKLVESAVEGGDATKDQLATLLKLSGAFASLTPATAGANKQIDSLNKTMQALGVNAKLTATKFDKSTTEMFESIGLSVEDYSKSIAGVLQGIMLGTIPAEEAGTQLANAAIGGITSAIAAGASQMIAAEFTNAIIAPIVSNIMAGKAALDGIDMESTAASITAQAGAVATALAALGPTLAGALNSIISSVSSVAVPSSNSSSGSSGGGGGDSPFVIGGGAAPRPIPVYYDDWIKNLPAMEKMYTQIQEANDRRTSLMRSMLDSDKKSSNAWEQIKIDRVKLWKEAGGDKWQAEMDNSKNQMAIVTKQIQDFYDTFVFQYDPVTGDVTEESANAAKKEMDRLLSLHKEHQDSLAWNESATADLTERLRQWTLAQQRLLATEELVNLKKEAEDAIAKTEELKLTGGITDPIKSLMSSYREKLKNLDEGLGQSLQGEIDKIKGRKNIELENKITESSTSISEITQRIEAAQDYLKTIEPGTEEELSVKNYIKSGIESLKSWEDRKAYLEGELAKFDKQNQTEIDKLNEELQKYKDGIEEWKKAQAELLSTEMLIDINSQIEELEKVEKAPLTTIKDAIQKYVDDFTELGTYTQEVQDAVNKLSDLQLTKAREDLYNQLLSEDELKLVQQTKLSKEFSDLGVALPASADALRAMIDAARAAGNITLADSLLELVPAFMALQGAAGGVSKELDEANKAFDVFKRSVEAQIKELEKTFTATDLAMRVLEKAVESEKKRLTEQLNTAKESVKTLQKIFDTLDKGIKDLRNEVDQTKQMQADEARRVIDVANLTGVLPDADRLSEAVSALTTSVKDGLYATAYDKSRAFLTLANDLETLKNTTEPQLTSAEQTVVNLEKQIEQLDAVLEQARKQIDELRGIDASLFGIDENITLVDAALQQLQTAAQAEEQARKQIDVLNQQLEMYQRQIDALNGIDTSVKSVEDAIRDLEAAIANMGSKTVVSTPETGGVYPPPYNGGGGGSGSTPGGTSNTLNDAYQIVFGRDADAAGAAYWSSILPSNASLTETIDALVRGAVASGEQIKLPGFAVGTNYVPKDMLANIHEGEMIIPKRFNPSTSGLQQDNSELIEELQALRAEVSMLRAEARATAMNTSKTARILDDVTQGGDTLKTEVAT